MAGPAAVSRIIACTENPDLIPVSSLISRLHPPAGRQRQIFRAPEAQTPACAREMARTRKHRHNAPLRPAQEPAGRLPDLQSELIRRIGGPAAEISIHPRYLDIPRFVSSGPILIQGGGRLLNSGHAPASPICGV